MSDAVIKGVKRAPSNPASGRASSTRGRKLSPARLKKMVKRSAAEKAPARKATKTASSASTSKTAHSTKSKRLAQPKTKTTKINATAKTKTSARPAAKHARRTPVEVTKSRTTKAASTTRSPAVAPPRPRQPTPDESAALRAFEHAHKKFASGRFAEARALFNALIERHAGVSEVTARARTYLAIAEARLRSESALPHDAESLYDRGVIELNRGEFVAAQEMFERALKREPEAAHIHYSLAATRARLGSISSALQSLERALSLQPSLRVRAQYDQDIVALRNEPEFERLIFTYRP